MKKKFITIEEINRFIDKKRKAGISEDAILAMVAELIRINKKIANDSSAN